MPHSCFGSADDGVLRPHAFLDVAADIGHQQDAIHRRDAEQRDEANRGRDAEIQAGDIEPENAAGHGERNARQRQQAVPYRIEQAVEQHQDQKQAQRHNQREPLLCVNQRAVFARPFERIALGERNVLLNPLLGLDHGRTEIAIADAILQRDEALAVLAVDISRAADELDLAKIA